MIEWTGERFIPWMEGVQIHYEHLHRYAFATQFVKGKRVLDLACGEGYGTYMMAQEAEYAVGIDIDAQTIHHASSKYMRENLKFIEGSIIDVPIEGKGKFDVAVCFEGIEHIAEHDRLLSEVKRLLKDDGLFIVSTPNKAVYTDALNFTNPFHVKELDIDEFSSLLKRYFPHIRMLGQRIYAGSNMWSMHHPKSHSYMEAIVKKDDKEFSFMESTGKEPVYIIALASNASLHQATSITDSWLTDASNSFFNEYQKQINSLNAALQSENSQIAELGSVLQAKDSQINELSSSLQAKDSQINELSSSLQAKDSQINELSAALQSKDFQIENFEFHIQQMQRGIVMQLVKKYQRVVEKVFRTGTRRRHLYGLVLRGIRAIMNEGWCSFVHKVRRYMNRIRLTAPRQSPLDLPKFNAAIAKKETKKLKFPVPSGNPDVSIIIPVYNNCVYTLNCLKSISQNTVGDYEVIVVDDSSTDTTVKILSKIKNLRLIRNEHNSGFVDSCNRGAKASKGKYILFLNNDTMVTKNWLPPMLELIKREDVGAVGSKLVYPDGTLQEAGGIVWSDASGWNYGRGDDPDKPEYNYVREVDYCSGASLMVKKELFEKIGGLDERFRPAYYEDADLCFSIRNLGYKVMYQPLSVVVHLEGKTSGTDISSSIKKHQEINKPKFIEKWTEVLQNHHYAPRSENAFSARGRRSGKNILVVDHYVPTRDIDAGSFWMFNILKILTELDHHVTFIGDNLLKLEPYTGELQQIGIEVVYSPHVQSIEEYIKKHGKHFDVVILSRTHIAKKHIDVAREFCANSKIVYLTHELTSVSLSRKACTMDDKNLLGYAERMSFNELYLARNSNCTITVSPVEKQVLLDRDASLNVEILSSIYDISPPSKSFSERQGILFVGGFDNPPNVDGILYFVNEIFNLIKPRLPDLCLYIVGSNPPKQVLSLEANDVVVTGYVKELSSYFEKTRVFIAPLRYGAGVKGKVVQSMCHGLPVVATSIGAEGLGLINGENALITDDARIFAENVIQLYNNEKQWYHLSRNSLTHVKNNFSSEVAKDILKRLTCNL